ncbi:MAG: EscU/YscU/HrcU family type III secretion system export apparatus switch protein, partial [Chthonomonadaceae bacterium]|nr:EscU/YscU/HrcU family type III secretion system export apparatus switch protein [Chthonomonadaceae bacterium]
VASNFAQVGFVLSGEPLSPRLDKLNPLPGIKRMFSSKAAFDGVKSFAKMGLFGAIASAAMQERWDEIVRLSWAPPAQAAATVGTLVHSIIVRIAVIWLILAVIDYIFQRKQIDKQLMMTKDELRREMKEQEGSPEVKYAQSQRRRKLAKGGLASKIKQADVIVTNPTHFAVAIKYERNSLAAPMVLAKGVDYLALKMREVAKSEKIPIVENKPLARALYKHCEAGDFVPRHLFGPVAEVLAYVYQSTKKARMRA